MFKLKRNIFCVVNYKTFIRNIYKKSFRLQETNEKRDLRNSQDKNFDVEILLQNIIQNKNTDWNIIRKEIGDRTQQISNQNIDFIIVKYLEKVENHNLTKSYIKFIQENNIEPNLATAGKIFRLYYAIFNKLKLPEDHAQIIYDSYLKLRSKYDVFDSISSESAILGLSLTKHWNLCTGLLENLKLTAIPTGACYSSIAAAAFRSKNYTLGWKMLSETIGKDRIPQVNAYLSYIDSISEESNSNLRGRLEDLLHFLGNHDIIVDQEVISVLSSLFRKYKIKCSLSKISDRGVCDHCKFNLPQTTLSEEEFNVLKSAFFEKVIIGKDIFQRTTPLELEDFNRLIKQNKTYDVVIDGLNVAYSAGNKHTTNVIGAHMVSSVVRHFAIKKKKILTLARNHIRKWPARQLCYVTQNSDLFLTQNLSHDDPYLLYCALNSGKNTILVTRDLMRNYLYLLNNVEHKKLFSRWLSQSQHQVLSVFENGNVLFKYPLPYRHTTQKQDTFWHIPFQEGTSKEIKWLCLKNI